MDEKIKIICLGGLDETGKDLTVIEIDDDIYIINCGSKPADKSVPGVDFIIARTDYLIENKSKVKAYIITHGHDATMAGLPYIYKEVKAPIYCSDVTKAQIETLTHHVHMEKNVQYDFRVIEPSSSHLIANRNFDFFQTAHNIAKSFGFSISTEQGNIVYLDDFVIDNQASENYYCDTKTLSKIAQKKTLLLLMESSYAKKEGYTAPKYRLPLLLEPKMREFEGRLFVALETVDLYNIEQMINLAIKYNRKIIVYDDETKQLFDNLINVNHINFPRSAFASRDEVNRIRAKEALVLITGFDRKLFQKIALLASHNNDDKRFVLSPSDTFVFGTTFDYRTEIVSTDALDELYRANVNVVYFKKNALLKMHASEEDLKTILNIVRPKYYLPIRGDFQHLLANAKLALEMNIGLSHMNVFVMDNGNSLTFLKGKNPLISQDKVITGDLFVDGIGIAKSDPQIVKDREQMRDGGVIVFGAIISKTKRQIIGNIDIQMRGYAYLKDNESLLKDLSRIFTAKINDAISKQIYLVEYIQKDVEDAVNRFLRRESNKLPLIKVIIEEIE